MNFNEAWHFFKEDLKDVIDRNREFKNSDYDKEGITQDVAQRLLFQMDIYESHIAQEKPERCDYRLKGWDWYEIADKLGISTEYDLKYPEETKMHYLTVENVLVYNEVLHYLESNYDNKEVVEAVREYLRAMTGDGEYVGNYDKVWRAMLEIEDDIVFMQFVFALLGHMWT